MSGDRPGGRLATPENKKWWTLAAVSSGLFMIMLDATVVKVALSAIRDSLHMKLTDLEWVVVGYALTFAAFMLTNAQADRAAGPGGLSRPGAPPPGLTVTRLANGNGVVSFAGTDYQCGVLDRASGAHRRGGRPCYLARHLYRTLNRLDTT